MARPQLTQDEISDFRQEACTAALQIITEQGLDALTLRSLGQKLGCSYAKPYRYFGDKDQLIDAVRAHAFDHFSLFMSGDDLDASGLPPIDRYVRFALTHRAAFEVMFGFNQPFVSPETRAAEDRAWEVCSQPIHELIEAGEIVGDANKIGHVFWVAFHGIATLSLAGKLTHGMNELEILAELQFITDAFRPES